MLLKINHSKTLVIVVAIISAVVLANCFSSISPPSDANPTCTVSSADFNGWFESGAVSLDGVVKPANSVTFSDVPNCDFYKWSEQMFLWLTSPAPARYGGGGRIFDSDKFFDVSPPDPSTGERTFLPHRSGAFRFFNMRAAQKGPQRLPVIFEKETGRMLEIAKTPLSDKGKQLVQDAEGKIVEIESIQRAQKNGLLFLDSKNVPILNARPIFDKNINLKTTVQKFTIAKEVFFLDAAGRVVNVEQGQAGGGEVLMAQNRSLVYYATIVNEVFAYYRTSLGTGAIPAGTRFPTTQAELDNIINFATVNGRTITDPEALAIEIKSSWVEAAGLPQTERFIKMKATVPTYDTTDPGNWVINGQKTVELAMVGMHVVGSTKGHPEMLWGTFEHVSNAPNAAFTYNNSTGTVTVPQNTVGNWVFCANGATGPFNEAHMATSATGITALSGFTVSPSNIIRWKAWGKGEPNASSNTEIISINNSVRGQLIDGDVRKNYIQTGTTWTIGGAAPNSSNQVGTNKLANSTMETFQQGTSNSRTNGTNCFSCHGTNEVAVSHVFEATQPLW